MPEQPEPLIEYPLDFPLKILGKNEAGFIEAVTAIVQRRVPDFDTSTVSTRPSKKAAYLSVTCVIRAQSREHLEALYHELSEHPAVVMVL